MKIFSLMIVSIVLSTAGSAFADCLKREKPINYYQMKDMSTCSRSELIRGRSKMKNVILMTRHMKARFSEKLLAEISLYEINRQLAMKSTR